MTAIYVGSEENGKGLYYGRKLQDKSDFLEAIVISVSTVDFAASLTLEHSVSVRS